MATASTLIDRVLRGFQHRGNVEVLQSDINDSVTSIDYSGYLPSIGVGSVIEIGSEAMWIAEVDHANTTASVIRGWLGTTATAHSAGDPIWVDSRVPRFEVLDLINDCLVDLFGQDLYAVGSQEITYDSGIIGYPLDPEAVSVIRVDALKDDGAKYWETVGDWTQIDNANASDFANGKAIMMRVALPPGAFRVIYSKPFTPITSESQDLQTDVGLRPYMLDLPFYYAMNRLMVDLERHRSQIESAESHQRAQDAPAFLALRTGEWYQARYADRIRIAKTHQSKETKRARPTGYGS